jgi:hypothetical protein
MALSNASRRISAFFALVLSTGAFACTGSSGDPSSAGPPVTDPGQPDGDDPGKTSGSCSAAPDLVFPLRQLGESDLIRGIRVDGEDLYFSDLNDIFKVPAAGGTPVVVAKAGVDFWITGDAILVLRGTGAEPVLTSTPKTGGDAKPVVAALPLADPNDSAAPDEGLIDATHLYWVSRDTKYVFNHPPDLSYSLHRAPLAGGAAETLLTSADRLKGLHKGGDQLYFLQHGTSDAAMQIPASGGAASPVAAATSGATVIGADDASLYYTSLDYTDVDHSGVFRAPRAGGASSSMYKGTILDPIAVLVGDKIAFEGIVTINKTDTTSGDVVKAVYSARAASGDAKMVGCFDRTYTVHALGASGGTAYVSIYKSADNVAGIARLKL